MNNVTRRDQTTMPKVANLPGAPAPQARPNRSTEQVYAEEAMRAYQRHIDQIAEIERIGIELEEWRRRAMLAEAEIKRLEKREGDLQDTLERRESQLIDERDGYRMKLNNLLSQFHTAGAIILKCIDAAQNNAGPNISLTALGNEIEKAAETANEPDEPMPRAVTAGPRES